MIEPEVGVEYEVRHSRKGTFTMLVTDTSDDTWVKGIITTGETRTIMSYNSRGPGEEQTVRRTFCYFIPLEKGGKHGK